MLLLVETKESQSVWERGSYGYLLHHLAFPNFILILELATQFIFKVR